MIIKERTKSKTLRIYESLAHRMLLSTEDFAYYRRLKSGYEGETCFDVYLRTIASNCLILNDLQLQNGKAEFQIDTIILRGGKVYVFDVKNHSGVYRWDSIHLKREGDHWVENPILQRDRIKSRLEIYLHNRGFDVEIVYRAVFVNPEFTLVGADRIPEFILPTEIPALLRSLNQPAPPVTPSERKMAEVLLAGHDADYVSRTLPKYNRADLEAGILCPNCNLLGMRLEGRLLTCPDCGQRMSARDGIRRSTEEFQLLFPGEKVTSRAITDWCGSLPHNRVYRTLRRHQQPVGKNRTRYYV